MCAIIIVAPCTPVPLPSLRNTVFDFYKQLLNPLCDFLKTKNYKRVAPAVLDQNHSGPN